MIQWIPCELHTHTVNSDGNVTLFELAQKAKELGLECIALTDHNTISGHLDIPTVMEKIGLYIIPGMEWTTFYGHMIAMGIKKYVDWRNRGPLNIHKGITDIHEAGGLAGVAHPFRLGSPMCTGCYWQFQIKDWNDVDYLEVWSETFPSINPVNHLSFALWTDLLNHEYRLTGVSGRDWHGSASVNEPIAVTYIGIDLDYIEDFDKALLNALENGRAVSTMGPLINLSAVLKPFKQEYGIGQVIYGGVKESPVHFTVSLDFYVRKEQWQIDPQPMEVVLMSNTGKLADILISSFDKNIEHTLAKDGLKWVRAELYGSIHNKNCLIGFTNPIYFQD